MFSQFLTILTSLAMLWHSIGGCCWHHDHQECDAGTALGAAEGTHSHPPGMRPHFHPHHQHHDVDGHAPACPAPCDPGGHCTGDDCVYVKSFTPDVTGLFHSRVQLVTPAIDLLAARTSVTLHTTDRTILHREELSAQQHCALTQSWLL